MVADISYQRGPPVIKSENARPNAWIYVDISTSDIGGLSLTRNECCKSRSTCPAGYTVTWSGQFEYMERAAARLQIVAPATLLIIFLLLYFNFRNITRASGCDDVYPLWSGGGYLADLISMTTICRSPSLWVYRVGRAWQRR